MPDDDLTLEKLTETIDRLRKPTEFEVDGHTLNLLDYEERSTYASPGKRVFVRKRGRQDLNIPRFAILIVDAESGTVMTNTEPIKF